MSIYESYGFDPSARGAFKQTARVLGGAVLLGAGAVLAIGKLAGLDDDPAAEAFGRTGQYQLQAGDTASGLGRYVEEHIDGEAGNDDYRPFQDKISEQAEDGLIAGNFIRLPLVLDISPEEPGVQIPKPEDR